MAVFLMGSCKTAQIEDIDRYIGVYHMVDQPLSRITIQREGIIYKIDFINEGEEWEGSAYESQGKLIAVLKSTDDEDAEFATLSLSGEDQLFVVARKIDGAYHWDGYFKEQI